MTQQPEVLVSDQAEGRIRKPADALRCLLACALIVLLAVVAVAASATMTGAETDLVDASRHLPRVLLDIAPRVVLFVLLALLVALGVSQLARRHGRRLAEAAAAGLLAGLIAAALNIALSRPMAGRLYYSIIMAHPGTSTRDALDPYLVGLVAYTSIIGLTGRTAWRNTLTVVVAVYAIVQLTALHNTVLTLALTLLVGRALGLAARYALGQASERPSALDIARALNSTAQGLAVRAIRRAPPPGPDATGTRYYVATDSDGSELDLIVYDPDQEAAGALYRIYRRIRVHAQVARRPSLSVGRTVERLALLSYASLEAGVPTPRLRAVVRAGPDTAVFAYDHWAGITLAERNPGCSDAEMGQVWDAMTRMHDHHLTHRALTADRILFPDGGGVMLLDPGDGEVAASDLQVHLDQAQLITELALFSGEDGPQRSAKLAIERLDPGDLVAALALLQPVAMARSTRWALRKRRDVLPAVRKQLLASVPGGEVAPVRLDRFRARTLITLVAGVFAIYLLAGELAHTSLGGLLRSANWGWGLAALGLSASTYIGASFTVMGFVPERLPFVKTFMVQLASSFVTLVTPAAVGGVALNVRYLQRRNVPSAAAVASVGVSQLMAFALHIVLLVIFAAISGTAVKNPIEPPGWAYFVVAGVVALAAAVLATPAGRRVVRARLAPMFERVLPRLLEVAQHPRKLAEGIGGSLLLSLSYILCLAACVQAFDGSAPIEKVAVVYLTGSALGSIVPTPGGLGTVELALTAELTASGVPSGIAVSAVLLYRLVTFWLPVPAGWVAMTYLERRNDL